jgi:hypothetical protein
LFFRWGIDIACIPKIYRERPTSSSMVDGRRSLSMAAFGTATPAAGTDVYPKPGRRFGKPKSLAIVSGMAKILQSYTPMAGKL